MAEWPIVTLDIVNVFGDLLEDLGGHNLSDIFIRMDKSKQFFKKLEHVITVIEEDFSATDGGRKLLYHLKATRDGYIATRANFKRIDP